jgi:RNA polymerase sigma-70 factor (ECF subfamily)
MATNQRFTDATFIKMILHGDLDKFEILIRRYSGMLYNTARSYGYNHCDAEKLMANAFLNAYQKLHRINQKKSFKKFLIDFMLKECRRVNKKNISLKHILVATFSADIVSFALNTY